VTDIKGRAEGAGLAVGRPDGGAREIRRGRRFRQDAALAPPVDLDPEVLAFRTARAQARDHLTCRVCHRKFWPLVSKSSGISIIVNSSPSAEGTAP